jgi:hypothetical protein
MSRIDIAQRRMRGTITTAQDNMAKSSQSNRLKMQQKTQSKGVIENGSKSAKQNH